MLRYTQILDATHRLLVDQELEDLGIYQIAKEAGVPPASAYHFFPTPGAALVGLAKRYLERFKELNLNLQSPADGHWQTLVRQQLSNSRDIFEANLPMRKLFLGCHTTRELVLCNLDYNQMMAKSLVEAHELMFHMPLIQEAPRKYFVALTAIDAIWRLSQILHGHITSEYLEESVEISIAYFRTFLPERLVPRAVSEVG